MKNIVIKKIEQLEEEMNTRISIRNVLEDQLKELNLKLIQIDSSIKTLRSLLNESNSTIIDSNE